MLSPDNPIYYDPSFDNRGHRERLEPDPDEAYERLRDRKLDEPGNEKAEEQ